MLTPVEIAAVVTAVKGAVDIFDKVAGQIKTVLIKRPKEAEAEDDRWRFLKTLAQALEDQPARERTSSIIGKEMVAVATAADFMLRSTLLCRRTGSAPALPLSDPGS